MTYVLPQVMVYQEVTQVPTAVVSNLNPFIYGANYSLRRYSEAAEKALIAMGAYNADTGNSGEYPSKIANSVVDQSYVKVYADNAWLKYQTVPNSLSNPLVLVSGSVRNRLRAAPRIVEGGQSSDVTMHTKGYHTGLVGLPEAYYFYPTETFDLGTDAGKFTYVTTEDLTGSMDIPDDATTAGVKVQGPHGLVMDFDASAEVEAPKTVTFADAFPGATGSFTIAPKSTAIKDLIDSALDASKPLTININPTAGSLSVTYVNKVLSINYTAATTLTDLRAAIVAVSDVLTDMTVSTITGSGAVVAITAQDQDGNVLSDATAHEMMPDVFRVYVYENSWIFKTANNYSRTASLYKDVEVGDKIKWTVTPQNTGEEISGYSTVAALEADYTMPSVGTADADDDNKATQIGTDISAGVANVEAGDDNQKTIDFDMTATKTYSLASDNAYPILSLATGVLSDDYVMTVTKGGVKGVAEMKVESVSGNYSRTGVLVEDAGANDGRVYVGANMYVDFKASAGGDGVFYVGDTYKVQAVKSPFTAVTNQVASGSYAGASDTVYTIEVTRGGVFDPVAKVIPGITSTADAVLHADISGWLGGDVDDEYILEVTSGGTLNAAVFSLRSQRGDNVNGVSFVGYGSGNAVTVGSSGLSLYFTTAAAPVFTVGDYFVVIVKAARPKVRVSDSAGLDQETTSIVQKDTLISVGLNGVKITFPTNGNTLGGMAIGGGLTLGDTFTVEATASKVGAVQTIVLSDDLPEDVISGLTADGGSNYEPDVFAADLMMVSSVKSIPKENRDPLMAPGGYNWTTTATTVSIAAGIKLQDPRWVNGLGEMPYLPLVHGMLYVEYRALLMDYTNAIYSLSDISQVVPQLGPAVEDNPLALAVYCALENIGRGTCYFTAIPTDDAAGDAAALAKAGLVKYTYACHPAGVTDPARHAVLEAHIASMSTEVKKRWRIGLVGRELPVNKAILTLATNPLGREWRATVTEDIRTGLITKVTLDQDGDLLSKLSVGDEVRLQFTTDAWNNVTYVTGSVAEIGSNTVFYLANALSAPVASANKIEVYHPLNVQEQSDAVKAISEGYANKRMYVVFPGNLGRFGTYVSAPYGAASVCGMVGSVAPQQGLTNITVNGYDDIPLAYSVFSYDQLNNIAEGGTLILMQDTKGGTVYVRHQISTAYQDGNLNTTELSMVKNLDSISFYFADLLAPFIGRYNVTPELVSVLRTQIQDGLNYLGSLTNVGLLGAQVILENGKTKIRTLEQHPTLKDRILAVVDIELPAPLNVIEFHIVV